MIKIEHNIDATSTNKSIVLDCNIRMNFISVASGILKYTKSEHHIISIFERF